MILKKITYNVNKWIIFVILEKILIFFLQKDDVSRETSDVDKPNV